ncbi:MAG: DUF2608 domain-containing protein, partial [Pseudobdellovibrionaceae bacterium]
FSEITEATANLLKNLQPEEVLVVFDIDNTLLRLAGDLGSEQWFLWQRELLDKHTQTLPVVTDSAENLLTVQSWIYNSQPMQVVDPLQRDWILQLRNAGTEVIALTSRSLNVHKATLREIRNNSILLSTANVLGLQNEGQVYLPYQLELPEKSGLTADDIENFKLGEPNPVLFDRGVFFTQGQNKGAMLKTLLARMKRSFKAIVFIDDRLKHVQAVREMATSVSKEVLSVHFNKSELWTIPFLEGDKEQAQADWCQFSKMLNLDYFPNPEARIYRSCL